MINSMPSTEESSEAKPKTFTEKLIIKSNNTLAYFLLTVVFLCGFCIAILSLIATSWMNLNVLTDAEEAAAYNRITSVITPVKITKLEALILQTTDDPILQYAETLIDELTVDTEIKAQLRSVIREERGEHRKFVDALETIRENDSELRASSKRYISNAAMTQMLYPTNNRLDRRMYEFQLIQMLESAVVKSQRNINTLTTHARGINGGWRDYGTDEAELKKLIADLGSSEDLDKQKKKLFSDLLSYSQQPLNKEKIDEFINKAAATEDKLSEELKPKNLVDESSQNSNFLRDTVNLLIKSAAMDFIYIFGMIGFGILGSSLTTFVGFKVKDGNDDLPDPELFEVIGVIVKGITAAIIVFLFIFGGFEVFSSGNTQAITPNAYMLFLTCFLGAVFSDRIWDHARERLTERLSLDQSSTQPALPHQPLPTDKP